MSADSPSHWIFLRGLARESAHWDDFPQRFVQAIPGARVHLLDLPGTGEHWHLASPLTIGDMVDFARREALARLSTETPVPIYLFSISLGSMVAAEWARRYPKDIAGVVLINASLGGFNPAYQRLSWRSLPPFLRAVLASDTAERERWIFRMTSALPTHSPALLDARVKTQQVHPVSGMNVARQVWAAFRYRPSSSKPAVPLLLLNSLGDRMVDPACSAAIASRWRAELKTHPWAGHDLPLDDPDWTAGAVRAWLVSLK